MCLYNDRINDTNKVLYIGYSMVVYIGFFLGEEPTHYQYTDNVVFLQLDHVLDYFQKPIYILDEPSFSDPFVQTTNHERVIQLITYILLNSGVRREYLPDGTYKVVISPIDTTLPDSGTFHESWQPTINQVEDIIQQLNKNYDMFTVSPQLNDTDEMYIVYSPSYKPPEVLEF